MQIDNGTTTSKVQTNHETHANPPRPREKNSLVRLKKSKIKQRWNCWTRSWGSLPIPEGFLTPKSKFFHRSQGMGRAPKKSPVLSRESPAQDEPSQIPPCSSTGVKTTSKQLKNGEFWLFGTWWNSQANPFSGDKVEIAAGKGKCHRDTPKIMMGLGGSRLLPGPKSAAEELGAEE